MGAEFAKTDDAHRGEDAMPRNIVARQLPAQAGADLRKLDDIRVDDPVAKLATHFYYAIPRVKLNGRRQAAEDARDQIEPRVPRIGEPAATPPGNMIEFRNLAVGQPMGYKCDEAARPHGRGPQRLNSGPH
jgi:ferritin-like protein